MTWRNLLKIGTERLRGAGIADAEFDARSLLFHVSGMTLTDYALRAETEADISSEEHFLEMTGKRASRLPLQYILGNAPFYGRDFLVGPGVLIPRFDTETLVWGLVGKLKEGMELLDLCTGSGCILITLLLEGPADMRGLGTDISDEALAYAERNAGRFGAPAAFIKSNLFESVSGTYDIITANPPYIRSADMEGLMPEVRNHEPEIALDGGEDGLEFYRRIAHAAPHFLKKGGFIGLEIGYDQAEDVSAILKENGFEGISVKRDLSWNTRAVIAQIPEI